MDDYANNTTKQKIIEKCIDNSYQIRNKISMSMFGWKSKLFNLKDSMIYNLLNLNVQFVPQTSSIHLLYKIYNPNETKGLKSYNDALDKFLFFSYRSNYKEQINIKNNSIYTSDCGWGCMIRSSQMIFSRVIYKIFKYIYKGKFSSKIIIKSIIPFFMDDNIYISDMDIQTSDYTKIGMDSYIQKLNEFLEEKIKVNEYKTSHIQSFDPPFSIHKICIIGEIFGRTCGEWFSDYELPKIYDIINTTFNIIPNLSIMHFNSDIDMPAVIDKCFDKIQNCEENTNLSENKYFFNEKNEKFIFKKIGVIFVSVRLGVSTISSDYYSSIKKLFECKQFLGFIGGKVNSAMYFFGYCDDDLLFLDPHLNQKSNNNLDKANFNTYSQKIVYKLPLKSLQSAFTIGFLFRNAREFKELYSFLKNFKKDEIYPCLHMHFEPYKKDDTELQKKIEYNFNNDEDDF